MPGASGRGVKPGSDARSCASLSRVQSAVWHSPAGETHQGAFITALAAGISQAQDTHAEPLDEQLFCEYGGWCPLKRHQAVYREPKACLSKPSNIASIL